ncbi:polyphenol oxidase A1, chloroplastic [Dendrobium catenatum]|uniref:polyphenol oxidase A1, chloroplastic n=1 Tax=Dendrobium catenatum TaxID=906689 RepID=UPI0009F4A60B|nr:polyphenol oxidase A1, chloroplastic [Dendrobium catenatum]
MRSLCTAKKPLLYSQPPPRHHHFLLLLLLFLTVIFLLYPRPLPPQRPIQPPDLSHCLLISINTPSSPPLNCCALSLVSSDLQILNFTFPLPSSPLRIRPAAHLVDSRYISQYSKAVQLMKDLPKSDPRNFFQQANIHCAYCNGAYDQLGFSNLQLLIHNSWLFFPWHRIYLYFHERILAKLIGDDSFALPFWNWDSPDGMRIPSMYLNNFFFNISSSSSSSLYHPNRDPSHQPPVMVDLNFLQVGSDQAVVYPSVDDNLRIMYRQMMENGATTELFLGSAFRAGEQPEPGPGSVEVIPHNTLHDWTGDPRKQNREDMGAFC